MRVLVDELDWFESDSGVVLAILLADSDGEYSGAIFAADLAHRYRWVGHTRFHSDRISALIEISREMIKVESNVNVQRVQGDEVEPVDFFTAIVDNHKLHESFRELASGAGFEPARRLVSLIMRWYENQDGNYVEQFQTTGFDARMWELYLFATLVESGFTVSQPDPAPDFLAVGLGGRFCVEATTVNPTKIEGVVAESQKPQAESEISDYVENYLPIRFAGPLTTKLKKRYWENSAVAGLPFLIAIQDFHDVMSMTYSGQSLPRYLYGLSAEEVQTDEGVTVTIRPVTHHRWKEKEIESGFFSFPGAEYISAVIFNGCGTLAKFNRIGVSVGLGSERVALIHAGLRISSGQSDAVESFTLEVTEGYEEQWIDGMNIYHNPNAVHPFDADLLPGAAHHYLRDEGMFSRVPYGHLLSSRDAVIAKRS